MSQGLFDEDSKGVDEAESDEVNEDAPVAPVRAVNRKTKQQRRKEKEQEEEVNVVLCLIYFIGTCMCNQMMTRVKLGNNFTYFVKILIISRAFR